MWREDPFSFGIVLQGTRYEHVSDARLELYSSRNAIALHHV